MFEPNNLLKECLEENPRKIRDIVSALEGYLNLDPFFRTKNFDNALDYVLDPNGGGVKREELFQEFDSDIQYEEDETKWDDKYLALAMVCLGDNFCQKRIDHLKAVAHKLSPFETAETEFVYAGAAPKHEQKSDYKEEPDPEEVSAGSKKGSRRREEDRQGTAIAAALITGIITAIIALIAKLLKEW